MNRRCIKTNENDNVAVAIREITPGEDTGAGFSAKSHIPQSHKIATCDICKGEPIVRYGAVLGYAKSDIAAGEWVNESSLNLPAAPELRFGEFSNGIKVTLPEPAEKFWEGYETREGEYAGTRNILGINTTVQCVSGVLNAAMERIKRDLLPLYPNVDAVVPVIHNYGCGVAINAEGADVPIRTLKNISRHPNFGDQIMAVGLGCEKLTAEMLLGEGATSDNVIMLQELEGFEEMLRAILKMADAKLKVLNTRRRSVQPLSKLMIGMQCGGSDAFSGITANPAAGFAADMLVQGGATVLFSENTEVRDGAHMLLRRCIDKSTAQRLAQEMNWYDEYLKKGKADRSDNPTPGNKKGGLANIVEKAMGSIAKSGRAQISEVISPGERPTKHGLIYAATPASDMVCGTCQLASGIGLQAFMTGRGTPYNLAAAPVIKVCSRSELKDHWFDLIDVNAGQILSGQAMVEDVGNQLFKEILDVASGRKQTAAERLGLSNDICLFNPAPIT